MKLNLVRFRRDHAENTAYYMAQTGVQFERSYFLLGTITQHPNHVVLISSGNDRPVRLYTPIQIERLEAVPKEEC
jgi:hypothetical protein